MWICIVVFLMPLIPSFLSQLEGWEPLGCWRDLPTRAIASLEGKSKLLSDNWKQRSNPLNACAEAAKEEKLKVFAVQDGGQCFGGPYAHIFYNQYGPSNLCKGGVGGVWSNNVYSSEKAYTRVLNTKKDTDKLVKCSRPLDMVFLIDGSGDSNVENKLRWDQMLKFVSKATEHFDTSSTRFGVISYGSEPKTIVNIHDNKDELSMRDSIISASFPGGPRTINEALKKAWKEQLKYTDRGRSKVIVGLATGSMEYGPWGSSLFLTNRGVRLLSLGIDRAPSYRYLETLASGKHPENIYSIDSEQLDQTLPYFAKDVCTGFTKGKIETIRKDKEIDLISSHDFETVGSIVERKSGKGTSSTSNAVNITKGKDAENNEGHDKKSESEEAKEQQRGQEKTKENKVLDNNDQGMQRENTSSKSDDMGNVMLIGPIERKTNDNKVDQVQTRRIFPVNNSSLSDGEIVERLKEDAVEVLKNTEHSSNAKNNSNITTSEKPMIREKMIEDNRTIGELNTRQNQTVPSAYDALSNSKTENLPHRELSTNVSYVENVTGIGKEGDLQKQRSLGGFNTTEDKTEGVSSWSFVNSKSNKNRGASNETLAVSSTEKANSSIKTSEHDRKPEAGMSKDRLLEGKGGEESTNKFAKNANSGSSSNQIQTISTSFSNRNSSSTSKLDFEDSLNSVQSVKMQNSKNHSSFQGNNVSKLREDNSKDLDKEIFDGLQQQRESIGLEEKEKDDEAILHEVKLDQDAENYQNNSAKDSDESFFGEGVPDDENTIDEDEKATQSALEQKRKEIDVLLKKLDETRRRRRRRKVRQRSKDSKDEDGVEDFEENDTNFMKTMGRHKEERKDSENGMETGDENSLMPAEPAGLSSHKGESKNLLSDISDDLSKKGNWDKYLDNSAKDGRSSYNVLAKNSESMPRKNGKGLNSEEQDSGRAKSSKSVLRKIVEEEANSIHGSEKSVHKLNQSSNEKGQHDKEERNVTKIDDYNRQISAKYKTDDSSNERSSNTSKAASTSDLTNASFSHERKLKHKDTEGDRKGATADEVWIFRPNPSKSSYKENYSTYSEDNKGSLKETGKAKFSLDSRLKSEQTDSKIKGETGGSEGLMLSRINQELGCTRPVVVLYAIDVSDAIGTGPTRQRKWNHMKRFLRSVNDKVIHGGSMGYIVYDTEPRFLSNLEPCDEKTEYFVTSGECLCDRKAAWFHAGRSSCSTHAPTDDESVEDWGKQGPRTAKALSFAEKLLNNETLGDAKKLVVLVTHEASTDDVTGAERSLKENSISLVDIEIGERHNIKKRSNRFDDVIPRDHQMEVSFYKLDKAIENIFTKICKEKDPTKTRRSKIFATLRKHKNWW